ncbi:MAG: DinB family protein [Spirochaetales bacterium]|nr:DinB family protein [Spirochaetales bacterium]
MDRAVVDLLVEYNRSANERMNAVIKTLTAEEWNRDLGGFFKSVRGLCSHLYVTDYLLLRRHFGLRDFKLSSDAFFSREYSFSDLLFPEVEEYLAARVEMDGKIRDFCSELTEEDFTRTLKLVDSQGTPMEKNFGGALLHGFNHETHHRGMISLYLEQMGKANDFSSLRQVVGK